MDQFHTPHCHAKKFILKGYCLTLILNLVICLFISKPLTAQDIHFSQIMESPMSYNPGLSGLFSGDLRIQAIFRSQWGSITVPYKTMALNAEMKLPATKGDFITFGGQIVHDKAGDIAFSTSHIFPMLNFHKTLSDKKNQFLSLGFIGGIVQRRFDRSKLRTNNQYNGDEHDPSLPDGELLTRSSYSHFDGTVGMSYNSQLGKQSEDNFFAGIAYHHFNQAKNVSFYENVGKREIPSWDFSGGIHKSFSDHAYYIILANYRRQGKFQETMAGGIFTWKLDENVETPKYLFHAGGYVRWKDALVPVVKVEIRPIRISASYDINISELSTFTKGRGGFELGLSYQVYYPTNSPTRMTRCPRF